jgi:hypothetical protein
VTTTVTVDALAAHRYCCVACRLLEISSVAEYLFTLKCCCVSRSTRSSSGAHMSNMR